MIEIPVSPDDSNVTRFNADAEDRAAERAWRSDPETIEEAHNRHPSRNPEVFKKIQALRAAREAGAEITPVPDPDESA